MENFRRLVLPVDGSAASARGITYITQLALDEGARVDVCSAIDEASALLPMAEDTQWNPMPLLAELEDHATSVANAAVEQLRAAGVTADSTILHGHPCDEVDAFARRIGADAIVVGTNGRKGMDRAFLGSLTTALLCIADLPVITVHADDEIRSGPILVAIDASSASSAALECAIARARVTGAQLLLLHVFEESRIERLSAALGIRTEAAQRQALTDAETALDDIADRVRSARVAFTTAIARGSAAETILATADTQDVRGIVIGTHGRGALERLFVGSVADAVVRRAKVPVLVVRRIAAKEPRAAQTSLEYAPAAFPA